MREVIKYFRGLAGSYNVGSDYIVERILCI